MMMTAEMLLRDDFEHPEGLVWDARRRRLLWVDLFKGKILSCDVASFAIDCRQLEGPVGAVAPRHGGGLVCSVRHGFALLSATGELSQLSTPLRIQPWMQMNDGHVDPEGRFWSGSTVCRDDDPVGQGSLYRLDPDGRVFRALDGVTASNGIGWSPEGARCYYIDSATRRIDAYDFDLAQGNLGKRTLLARTEAVPDGLAVDVDGCVWVAMYGGGEVHRFTPTGELDRRLRLPGRLVTTCAFGGDDLRTLFVAVSRRGLTESAVREQSAGHIFQFYLDVQGLPGHEFAG